MRIEISKSARRLAVYGDGERGALLMACRIALGLSPEGHKQREGDGKTPEGEYIICEKKPDSKYRKALALNYPCARDAYAALEAELCDRDVLDAIIARLDQGRRPPWGTELGGEIYIHGGGARSDWTAGCIALDDAHIDALYAMVQIGCPVIILP